MEPSWRRGGGGLPGGAGDRGEHGAGVSIQSSIGNVCGLVVGFGAESVAAICAFVTYRRLHDPGNKKPHLDEVRLSC